MDDKGGDVISRFLFVSCAVLLAAFMLMDPRTATEAARNGLILWSGAVLPALLPFFIVCDLLVAMQVVRGIGLLLNSVMGPLFNLPGAAGFVLAMGFTSGFPTGAVLSNRLHQEGLLSHEEAQRLAVFTNNASPLFLLGVVGVGLFGSQQVGWLLAFSLYVSNLAVGMVLGRLSPRHRLKGEALANNISPRSSIFSSPGALLGESVKKGITNVLAVGGFIVLFSVAAAALNAWGITGMLGRLLQITGLSYGAGVATAVGLVEMTLGAQALSLAQGEILEQLLCLSAVLAWSGLSIQAQVIGMAAPLKISYSYLLKARLLQMALSVPLTLAGFFFLLNADTVFSLPAASLPSPSPLNFWQAAWIALFLSIAALLAAAGGARLFRTLTSSR